MNGKTKYPRSRKDLGNRCPTVSGQLFLRGDDGLQRKDDKEMGFSRDSGFGASSFSLQDGEQRGNETASHGGMQAGAAVGSEGNCQLHRVSLSRAENLTASGARGESNLPTDMLPRLSASSTKSLISRDPGRREPRFSAGGIQWQESSLSKSDVDIGGSGGVPGVGNDDSLYFRPALHQVIQDSHSSNLKIETSFPSLVFVPNLVPQERVKVTPKKPSVPRDVLLIRKVLSAASPCIPAPIPVRSHKGPDRSLVLFSESGIASNSASCLNVEPIPRAVSVSDPCLAKPNPPLGLPDSSQEFTLEKYESLKAFNLMCVEAKKMGIDVVGRAIHTANFSAAKLDSRGGYLSVDALDVYLYVPPGAIRDGASPQTVYLFVQANLNNSNNYLTPCVHCGPSTLRFSKDVILTLPHCAKNATDFQFSCVKTTSGGFLREIQDGRDGVVLVERDSVTITMDHFCGYSASADVSVKYMVACVFIYEERRQARIRIRLFDGTKANLQEVKTMEQVHGFILADPYGHLEVQRSGRDVLVTLTSDVESWKITDPENGQQTFQYAFLWRDNRPDLVPAFPAKSFHATCHSQEPTKFRASMKVYQVGRQQYGVDLNVKKPPQNIDTTALNSASAQLDSEELIQRVARQLLSQIRQPAPVPTTVRLLDEGIVRRLCDVLDAPMPDGRDWHILPESLFGPEDPSYGFAWVRSVERRAEQQGRSPTELILDTFFARSKETGKGKVGTLQSLKQGLVKMRPRRPDVQFAIDAVGDRLKKCGMNKMPPHQALCHPDENNNPSGVMGVSPHYPDQTGMQKCASEIIIDPLSEPNFIYQRSNKRDSALRLSLPADFDETSVTLIDNSFYI